MTRRGSRFRRRGRGRSAGHWQPRRMSGSRLSKVAQAPEGSPAGGRSNDPATQSSEYGPTPAAEPAAAPEPPPPPPPVAAAIGT